MTMTSAQHIQRLSRELHLALRPAVHVTPPRGTWPHASYAALNPDGSLLYQATLHEQDRSVTLHCTRALTSTELSTLLTQLAPLHLTELTLNTDLTDPMREQLRTCGYRFAGYDRYRTDGPVPILTRAEAQQHWAQRPHDQQVILNLPTPTPSAEFRQLLHTLGKLDRTVDINDVREIRRSLNGYAGGYDAAEVITQLLQLMILTDLDPLGAPVTTTAQIAALIGRRRREEFERLFRSIERDFKGQGGPDPAGDAGAAYTTHLHRALTDRLDWEIRYLSRMPEPLLNETLTPWAAALRATDLTPLRPPLQAAAQAIIAAEDNRTPAG